MNWSVTASDGIEFAKHIITTVSFEDHLPSRSSFCDLFMRVCRYDANYQGIINNWKLIIDK